MRSNFADRDAQPGFASKLDAIVGAEAAIIIPADTFQFWCLDWIQWSYSLDDVSGLAAKIQIFYANVLLHEADVTRGGPGLLNYDRQELYHADAQKKAVLNEELKVALAPVVGATGKLSIRYR